MLPGLQRAIDKDEEGLTTNEWYDHAPLSVAFPCILERNKNDAISNATWIDDPLKRGDEGSCLCSIKHRIASASQLFATKDWKCIMYVRHRSFLAQIAD